jgi:methionyl-tRNA synthetase
VSDEGHRTDREQPEAAARARPAAGSRIGIDRFLETELRVAEILAAEPVPDAERLLKLRVSLGDEERQLVAGIARSYDPRALVGKRIIVVSNLEPARIRGVESQGMLLAADVQGRPVLATFDEPVAPGTRVR